MLQRFALTLLLVAIASCAAPSNINVPHGASMHWSVKDGAYHTWTRRSLHGCVSWTAYERWADVQLALDSRCEGPREQGYLPGRGVSYLSAADHLYLRNYWPWTMEDFLQTLVFGEDGMIREMRGCPHTLPPAEIAALRALAQEALNAASTDAERRVLARVDARLAATDGAALGAGQQGCTDLSSDTNAPRREAQNVWVQD